MRTYQILRPASGGDAVMNSLVMGTAFIWVPIVVLIVGWQLLSQKLEIGEYSPKAVAQRNAEQAKSRAIEAARKAYVHRDADGKPTWTSTENPSVQVHAVLPVKDKSKPKLTWIVGKYTLTDVPCVRRNTVYGWDNYQYAGPQKSGGCYAVRNGVVGLSVTAERVIFFDVKDVVEQGDEDNFKGNPFADQKPTKQSWRDDPIVKPTVAATPERQRLAKAQALCSELYPLYRQHRLDGLCYGEAYKELRAAKDAVARAAVASKPTVAVEKTAVAVEKAAVAPEPVREKRVPSLDEAYELVATAKTPAELRKATDAVSLARALAN